MILKSEDNEYEISSRIVHQVGNVQLSIQNYYISWYNLFDKEIRVRLCPLYHQQEEDSIVPTDEVCLHLGCHSFTERQLLEVKESELIEERRGYLCYLLQVIFEDGNHVASSSVKIDQSYLMDTLEKFPTEFEAFCKWLIVNKLKRTRAYLKEDRYIIVNGRYEMCFHLIHGGRLSNPLNNTSNESNERNQLWIGKDFKNKCKVVMKFGIRTENEFENLQKIKHSHIIQTLDHYPSNEIQENAFVTFLYKGLNLRQLIESKDNNLTFKEIREIVSQIVDAIAYLHDMGIVHKDIKHENILIEENLDKIWLVDFDENSYSGGCTIFLNQPPEKVLSMKADIWALGVLVYQLITKDLETNIQKDFLSGRIQIGHHIDILIEQSNDTNLQTLAKIVRTCLQEKQSRPTIYGIYEILYEEELELLEDIEFESDIDEEIDLSEIDRDDLISQLSTNGMKLRYIPYSNQDMEMVTAAVNCNCNALEFTSPLLKESDDFIDSIQIPPECVKLLGVDKQIRIIKKEPSLFHSYRQLVLQAVKHDSSLFHHLTEELKSDSDIFIVAIENGLENYEQYLKYHASSKSVALVVVELYPSQREHFIYDVFEEIYKDHLDAINKNPLELRKAPKPLKSYSDFVIQIAKKQIGVLEFASDILKSDRNSF
ncbi:predicted protein [Naegleria gruberi]|uniref:Predicted protein n=1 Tax=Naegleria gruberi TaxID=5762 RepID=D2VA67_NAEGR|nr:uncharacterized protein NAEGRDRAFT_47888 [Naegleria gruberi]EFC46255.1 predicted protein [Naegleria gruberi]|eukprot:XP_002678999.1 predicted protein [Naegleria gruberi strain NEG-M]